MYIYQLYFNKINFRKFKIIFSFSISAFLPKEIGNSSWFPLLIDQESNK